MAAQDLQTITCDRRAFTKERCDISKPDRLGYYSKKENEREKTISVDLKTDNASYLNPTSYRLRGLHLSFAVKSLTRLPGFLTDPYQALLSQTYNLAAGFDRFVPPLTVGNRLDNLYEWLLRTKRANRPDTEFLSQVS